MTYDILKNRIIYWSFLCWAMVYPLFGQLIFDDDFDNGFLGTVVQNGNLFTLEATAFLHFCIRGALNQSPEFVVDQGNDYIFRNDHRMLFRAEGDTNWYYFDNGHLNGSYYYFSHNSPFNVDTIYIAYWFPWTFENVENYMTKIAGHPFVRNDSVRGYSLQNRPIFGFEVTDETLPDSLKQHVVLVARQHANEPLGNHIMRKISDYLIFSQDSTASELRQKAVFYFYPMANPDGVYLGQGYGGATYLNLNRYWYFTAPSVGSSSPCIETDVLRQAIWDDTGGSAAYAFDLHSHPGHIGQYYWWGLLSGPTQPMVQAAQELVSHIHNYDAANHSGHALVSGQIAQDVWASPGPYADYWFVESLGAVGFTFEAGSVPPQPLERIEEVGIAFCQGLNDMLPMPVITQLAAEQNIPFEIQLFDNYPNPFNHSTMIEFQLTDSRAAAKMFVTLKIYNTLGGEVATLVDDQLPQGKYQFIWNASGLASGVYFCRLQVAGFSQCKKLFLLR